MMGTLEPGVDYVFSIGQHAWLTRSKCMQTVHRVSHLEPRVRNFVAPPYGGGGSLIFYAGAGGYGDQLMAIPVARMLADLGFVVTVLVDPGNQVCWYHLPFIKAVLPLPIPYADFKLFDHHCLLQLVTNVDEHGEQWHPVDAMLYRIGIDPRTVTADRKVVAPVITPEEMAKAVEFVGGRRIGLYQMGGSGENRRLRSDASRHLFMGLAEQIPDLVWLGLYDHHIPGEYYAPLPVDAPGNAQLFTFQSLRQLFAVATLCEVGVSIDSLLVHLLGSFGKPCIGLWGQMYPPLRIRYYRNHTTIWNRDACSQSPCLRYKPGLEKCPPSAKLERQCLCLKEVEVEQVAMAVRAAM